MIKRLSSSSRLLLFTSLALSALTHLWNPIGFPGIYFDESIYAERSVRIIEGLGPQDPASRYDHPFFGQIFFAAMLSIIGYPEFLDTSSGNAYSIEMAYSIPRVIMGVLALIDTFLIYKIVQFRHGNKVAFIASILFAVMPLTWLTRRILLDSIMLPFILSSILFAVYYNKKTKIERTSRNVLRDKKENKLSDPRTILILISGIFLGLAIFTKISAFTFIPLVAYLIFTGSGGSDWIRRISISKVKRLFSSLVEFRPRNNNIKIKYRNLKALLLWLIPVILIPTIWPVYSIYNGELNKWLDPEGGVLWQTQDRPLFSAISSVFEIDPVLVVLGMVAIIYITFVKREGFLLLWVLPFVIFSYFIGSLYFHMIPLIPVFCIAIAIAIGDIGERMRNIYKPQRPITDYFFQRDELLTKTKRMENYGDFYLLYSDLIKKFRFLGTLFRFVSRRIELLIVLPLALFGLMSIIVLIQANVNSSYFITIAFLLQHLPDRNFNSDGENNNDITIVGSPRYFWILEHIFDKDYFYKSYNSKTPIQTERNVFIVDNGARGNLPRNEILSDLYDTTSPIETINADASQRIEIRSSDIQMDLD